MKKLFSIATTILVIAITLAQGQQAIHTEISQLKASGAIPKEMPIVTFVTSEIHKRDYNLEALKKGTIVKLSNVAIAALLHNRHDFIQIDFPVSDRSEMKLTLKRHEIFTSDFMVHTSSDPGRPFNYKPGVHYRGIVEGESSSVVALSVFEDQVTGLIANNHGNFVIGRIENDPENKHIFYNDKDLDTSFEFACGTPDDGLEYTKEQLLSPSGSRDPGDCIRVYVEIDDIIVTDMGGAANALSFVTSIFNQTITLYANEGITMSISEIFVWTTTSPYTGNTAGQMLTSYQNNTGPFNGNLSHLVSFKAMGGGVAAGFNGICNSNPDLSKCFSGIFPVYQVVPLWSWAVNVTAHEMGHLIGSRHTHACVWNFNNTAIDGCAGATEGNCPLPGNPPGGGTIMSYCQNAQGIGVNFNLGFGQQPGNVLRNTVIALGNCLSSSCTPAPSEYCWAAGGEMLEGQEFWIQSVNLESINNVSGNSTGYYDFTAQSTTLNTDSTYTISMTAANQGVNYAKAWGVYIDYNRDFDFYDAGEQVAAGNGSLLVNFTFTVPASSPSVTTRMRVAMRRQDTGSTSPCGFNAYGEVEDYTVIIDASGGPTCSDGAQNGDETGVDCGGTTCPVCPTCTDGIQNGDEEGVDCGGSCDACPGTVLFGHFFETGWDGWTDGGADAARYSGSRSWEGSYSINLQDNSADQSAMTSPVVDLTGFTSVQLDFYFYSNSVENGEDFFVRYYNGSTYTTVATFPAGYGGSFANNSFWVASVILTSSQVNFVSNARFRIQCDASDNNDDLYIDAVTLTAYNSNALLMAGQWVRSIQRDDQHDISSEEEENEVIVYPNPAGDYVIIDISNDNEYSLKLFDVSGKLRQHIQMEGTSYKLATSELEHGIYFIQIKSQDKTIVKSLVILH